MGKHRNEAQDSALITFMEQNSEFAKGYKNGDREFIDNLWKELAEQLNSLGPPLKDCYAWKKTWLDWKLFVRRKLEKYPTGTTSHVLTLSSYEHRLCKICGFYEDGVENGDEPLLQADKDLLHLNSAAPENEISYIDIDKLYVENKNNYNGKRKMSYTELDPMIEYRLKRKSELFDASSSQTSKEVKSTVAMKTNSLTKTLATVKTATKYPRPRHRNEEQDYALISFMEENLKFSQGYLKGEKELMDKLWTELTEKLNNLGPPIKDCYAWKKTWLDWRLFVRRKLEKYPAGKTSHVLTLSSNEHRIAKIAGFYADNDGDDDSEKYNDESLQSGVNKVDVSNIKTVASEEEVSYIDVDRLCEVNEDQNEEPMLEFHIMKKSSIPDTITTKPSASIPSNSSLTMDTNTSLQDLAQTAKCILEEQRTMRKCLENLVDVIQQKNRNFKDYHRLKIQELRRHNKVTENKSQTRVGKDDIRELLSD